MLNKEVVVVTGANSGIGYAAIKELIGAGYEVIGTSRSEAGVAEIEAAGGCGVRCDFSQSDAIGELVQRLTGGLQGKRLAGIFLNAGYGLQCAMEDCSMEALREQLEVNTIAPVGLINGLKPEILRHKTRLVFCSSILGVVCAPLRGPYAASKFALEAIADGYRLEWSRAGVDVVTIRPGPIKARFRARALQELTENVSLEESLVDYSAHMSRLGCKENTAGTLPADSVGRLVCEILKSRKPRTHYSVTRAAKVGGWLKRWLPTRWLDRVLLKTQPVMRKGGL